MKATLYAGNPMPQYLPSAAQMDAALDGAFATARALASARKYRESRLATWLCPKCRVWTRPSRGPSPDVCEEVACRRPRPALEGRPAAGAAEAWRQKVRPQTVVRA